MENVNFEIRLEGDTEGYISFECPFCESEFKLQAGEFESDDNVFLELYCPYCGLIDEVNNFYTKEVVEQVEALANNYIAEQFNKVLGKLAKDLNRNKFIKMEWKPLKKVNTKELKDKDTVEEIFECSACGNHEKALYCAGVSKIFCSYCGVDI